MFSFNLTPRIYFRVHFVIYLKQNDSTEVNEISSRLFHNYKGHLHIKLERNIFKQTYENDNDY